MRETSHLGHPLDPLQLTLMTKFCAKPCHNQIVRDALSFGDPIRTTDLVPQPRLSAGSSTYTKRGVSFQGAGPTDSALHQSNS